MPNCETPIESLSPLPKGIRDILPEDQEYLTFIKKVVRHRCRQSGYRRITTPIFEYKKYFEDSLGSHSQIAQNNLYEFIDKDNNILALKPEGVTGLVRAYVGHKMYEDRKLCELFYIEPFFEFVPKTKKPFYRSFLEFGLSAIGEPEPTIDAQVIYLAHKLLEDLSIRSLFLLELNNLGCVDCQQKFLSDFKDFFIGKERSLCFACRDRLETDLWDILRCDEEDCKILCQLAPKLHTYWCESCKSFFNSLCGYLDALHIPYKINNNLLGKYNFYTKSIFSFSDINSTDYLDIVHGGRYDTLIKKFGGPDTHAVGFSMKLEKVIRAMKREHLKVPSKDDLHVFIAQLSDDAKKKCLVLITRLREAGIKTVGILGKGSIREQISLAEKFKAPYMLIMGLTEVRENMIILRDMRAGTQRVVEFDTVIDEIKKLIGEKAIDMYSPGELLY